MGSSWSRKDDITSEILKCASPYDQMKGKHDHLNNAYKDSDKTQQP